LTKTIPSPDEYLQQGALGRHETFTPRYGWLVKGCRAVSEDSHIFNAPDAIERLGVGKNMVSSIRFWCLACKLIEPAPQGGFQLTRLGERLITAPGAWDPFLEDTGSLWLLHWQIFVPRLEAVTWPLAFNRCQITGFDARELGRVLRQAAGKYQRFAGVSPVTFERDASCLIRMYADCGAESDIDCPFTQLRLLCKAAEKNTFSFNAEEKPDLPPLIFAAACFSFIKHYQGDGIKTITLQRLSYDFNAPGVVFKISESAAGSLLEQAATRLPGISLEYIAGNVQLHLRDRNLTLDDLYWTALEKYYEEQA